MASYLMASLRKIIHSKNREEETERAFSGHSCVGAMGTGLQS